jgi:peptidyl-tRNA hydrolase, PTH2 family
VAESELKQVIVVNDALQLPTGKLAAQVAHAALAAYLNASPDARRQWLSDGMTKIVLKCEDENTLLTMHAEATKLTLPVALVRDAGHTVVPTGTMTCVGIGPGEASLIDSITGGLRLVR